MRRKLGGWQLQLLLIGFFLLGLVAVFSPLAAGFAAGMTAYLVGDYYRD